MNKKFRRISAILIVICISIAVGFIIDAVWNTVDRKKYPRDYREYIIKYSEKYNVPAEIIYAVIKVESNFDADAESVAGAVGLMQMIPSTFEWLTSDEHLCENLSARHLRDPEVSIRYGTYYLFYLKQKFGDWDTVLAAYNAGEGNVTKWLADSRYSDGDGKLKDIPFSETRRYVAKVNEAMDMYMKLYEMDKEHDYE